MWIARVNGSTVTQPDINNIPQNSWSTRNKKGRGKTRLSFNYLVFSHVSYFIFKGQRGKHKIKSLSPFTNRCDGSLWPKWRAMDFLISAATGTCQTNLSYLPSTRTFKPRLPLHHPGFVLHPSPKLVGSLSPWRLTVSGLCHTCWSRLYKSSSLVGGDFP